MHALALWRAGKSRDAARAIDRALSLGTKDADLYLYRALVVSAEDRAQAKTSLERALELNPSVDPLLVAELQHLLEETP